MGAISPETHEGMCACEESPGDQRVLVELDMGPGRTRLAEKFACVACGGLV